MDEVGRDSRGRANPAYATDLGLESEDGSLDATPGLGEIRRERTGDEEAAGRKLAAEEPGGVIGSPWAVPSKSIAIDQSTLATGFEVLNDPIEDEAFR